MQIKIQPYDAKYMKSIVALSLHAWEPVFKSIKKNRDKEIYNFLYPDWRVTQQQDVERVCNSEEMAMWIAFSCETVAGFVAIKLDSEIKTGEIYMIAVDPNYQRQGICRALIEFALQQMKKEGMAIATVSTGADPGHAPARYSYEKLGFSLWPVAMYLKRL